MSDLWLIEYEQAWEAFESWSIDRAEFERRLKSLGFDPMEISEQVAAVLE